MEEHVMPSASSHLAGPLSLHLTDHICQVQTTHGVRTGCVTHHLDRIHLRHRFAAQESDQLSDRCDTEHVDPCGNGV